VVASLAMTFMSFAGGMIKYIVDVAAARLVASLKGDGPFTVFAPTDEAFAKLPAGTLEMSLIV